MWCGEMSVIVEVGNGWQIPLGASFETGGG